MAKDLVKIRTDRLILRGINESDAVDIVEWRSDPDVYKYFKSPHRITVKEHFYWYNNVYLRNEKLFNWMCIEKDTGKKMGVFGFSLDDESIAEVNYLLSPGAQHKGYATEAVTSLVSYAFVDRKATSVKAEIHRDNERSVRLARKLGFTLQSTKGDFLIYSKTGG